MKQVALMLLPIVVAIAAWYGIYCVCVWRVKAICREVIQQEADYRADIQQLQIHVDALEKVSNQSIADDSAANVAIQAQELIMNLPTESACPDCDKFFENYKWPPAGVTYTTPLIDIRCGTCGNSLPNSWSVP